MGKKVVTNYCIIDASVCSLTVVMLWGGACAVWGREG